MARLASGRLAEGGAAGVTGCAGPGSEGRPPRGTSRATATGQAGVDLLRYGPLRAVLRWGGFPYVCQALLLALFVMLAVLGWGWHAPEGVPAKLYAKNHVTNLAVWGLWWPSMIWLAVLFGRVWCAVCPLELVSNVTERLGRRRGVRQRVLGRWLRGGALTVVLYLLLQLLVAGASLHRVPAYTSIFLWSVLALAAVVGLLWRDRAFCRGFCPVGVLLRTYGRGGCLAIRPTVPAACGGCESKGCVLAARRALPDARSCPSLLNPAKLDESTDCLLCGQCLKSCGPQNMGLFLRPLFAAHDARDALASWPVTVFVMLASGFVLSEICAEWPAAQALFQHLPEQAAATIGWEAGAGWIEGLWTLLVVPVVLWAALGGVTMVLGGARNLFDAWRRLALPVAVVVAAAHMSKGLAKVTSWIGHLPYALHQPDGVATSLAMAAKELARPAPVLPLSIASDLGLALMVVAAWFAVRELRLADGAGCRRRVPAAVLLAALYGAIICGWRWAG